MTLEDKYEEMTTEPVKGLVCKMAVPTIIAMVTTALYNVVDAAFIGRLSTEALSAEGVPALVCGLLVLAQRVADARRGLVVEIDNGVVNHLGQRLVVDVEVSAESSERNVCIRIEE